MKKAILPSTDLALLKSISKIDIRRILLAIWILLFLLLTNDSYSQFCTMVCDNSVNVSLNSTCNSEITYDMILEDPDNNNVCFPNGPGAFEVTVMNILQAPIPTSPFVTSTAIGNSYTVKVTHIATGNNCWGNINVEDKLPPSLTCPPDISIACTQSTDPTVTGTPIVDDCSNFSTTSYDLVQNLGCNNPTSIITRTWTALDIYGNSTDCTQLINIEQPDITTVQFPPNLDGITNPALNCGNANPDPFFTGYPTIGGAQVTSAGVCNMAVTYSDQTIPICDGTDKILRTWTVAEWCSGTVLTHIQVIKIEDAQGPQLICPADLTVSTTSSLNCEASVLLAPASVFDNCSATTSVTVSNLGPILFSNGGLVHNVNMGTYTVTYTAYDDCNNSSTCDVILTVEDGQNPVMICDEITTITINQTGMAFIPAAVFDDGSYDNCCFDDFAVRRMVAGCGVGTNFGPTVKFCCEDIGNPDVMVELQGTDCAGNTNSCMVSVILEDNIDPTITCPSPITLECTENYNDLNLTGTPTLVDACGTPDFTFSDANNLNNCGVGTITRTFTADDGSNVSCSQIITLIDNTPISVVFPPDYELFGCTGPEGLHQDSLPAPYNFPVVTGDNCEQIAYNVEDQFFQVAPPACFKIVRTWTVIDWCVYQPNSGSNAGVYTEQQILKVFDNEAPIITCPAIDTIEIIDGCAADVILPDATATDCSEEINFTVNSDFGIGSGPFTDIAIGTYNAVYAASDGCGNSASCTTEIVVVDGKKPTAYCVDGLIIEIMNTNPPMIDIWANDFDAGSFDNCGPVVVSFSADTSHTSQIYTCDHIGEQIIQMWVTDIYGNQDFCETFVQIQDNMGLCMDGNLASVSGAIHDESGANVENVTVTVNDGVTDPITTGPSGDYQFIDLVGGNDYTVTPEKDMNPLNGVTTLDLVTIRKHILGTSFLETPYKLIAADVNASNTISTSDLVELRKMILFINLNFENNTSWRFVDANYEFQNPTDPFAEDFPEVYNINNLSSNMLSVDFMGIKVGDVNDSAIANNLLGADDRNNEGELILSIDNQAFEANELITVDFKAKDFKNILGYQFTLNFDKDILEFQEINRGILSDLSESNFGFSFLNEGKITTNWENTKIQSLEDDAVLFSLVFEAKTAGDLSEILSAGSALTVAEAYRSSEEIMDVALHFSGNSSQIVTSELQLYGNKPNPFHNSTIVSFSLSESQNVELTVFSVSGSVLYQNSGWYGAGKNEIQLTKEDLKENGMLIYSIKTATETKTGKMVMID